MNRSLYIEKAHRTLNRGLVPVNRKFWKGLQQDLSFKRLAKHLMTTSRCSFMLNRIAVLTNLESLKGNNNAEALFQLHCRCFLRNLTKTKLRHWHIPNNVATHLWHSTIHCAQNTIHLFSKHFSFSYLCHSFRGTPVICLVSL